MAKNRRAEHLADFSGPDADKANIEKLAAAAREANKAGAGHNSEPPDEVIKRNADAIEVALVEIDAAGRIMQKARAGLKAARVTAKTDLGSQPWVDAVQAAVKLKRQTDKAGMSGLVSDHRQIGRVLRVMGSPLGTQFNLFAVVDETVEPKNTTAHEAQLAGEHAGLNGEPVDNCPHVAGTPEAFAWRNGHQVGADKLEAKFRGPTN